MNIHKIIILSLLVIFMCLPGDKLSAEPVLITPNPVIAADDAAIYDKLDAYLEQQMRNLKIPGISLVVVEGDSIVHQRGFGKALQDGNAPTPQTCFFIGSLTKSFTALAVMQLVETGKIELDAPVQNYLPWFRVADSLASTQITVRHLLNQTSGLSEASGRVPLADFDSSANATERQVRALANQKLDFPVGSAFEYSNSNYNILGLIIEAASGEPYADYIQKNIFIPFAMNHSFCSKEMAKQNGLAIGHRYWFAVPVAVDLPVPQGSLPSGQLLSCTEDMAHYLIAHLNGGCYGDAQILSPAGMDELHRGVAESIQMGMSFGKYSMGWFEDEIEGTRIAWHTGIVPNYFSYMTILPVQKKGIVLLFNAYGYLMTPVLSEIGSNATALLAGQQPEPSQLGIIVWIQRCLLLIPFLQIFGVIILLRRLRRWHREPNRRPGKVRLWCLHILLPLIPNLLIASTLISMLGATRGFWMLYMPDYAWIAIICGSFAVIWIFLRTWLILNALRKE